MYYSTCFKAKPNCKPNFLEFVPDRTRGETNYGESHIGLHVGVALEQN